MNSRKRATGGPSLPTGAAHFRQAQEGCRDSLARLMAAHEGLVQAVVRKQVLGQLPFAEALQAGRIGLWRAILGFDPERGHAFSTYAWTSCTMFGERSSLPSAPIGRQRSICHSTKPPVPGRKRWTRLKPGRHLSFILPSGTW